MFTTSDFPVIRDGQFTSNITNTKVMIWALKAFSLSTLLFLKCYDDNGLPCSVKLCNFLIAEITIHCRMEMWVCKSSFSAISLQELCAVVLQ
jgi:hypothetical protein